MPDARPRPARPEPAAVLEAGVGTGLDHDAPVDHAVVHDHRPDGGAIGPDRVGALRRTDDPTVEESAELAVHVDRDAVLAGSDDLAIVVDDAVGLAADADAAGSGDADLAVVDDVVALAGGDDDRVGRVIDQLRLIADGVVNAGNLDRVTVDSGGIGINADRRVTVDRVGRYGGGALDLERDPGLVALGVDMQHGRVLAVDPDPIDDEVVFVAPAGAADALEVGDDRARVVIGGEGVGRPVVDVAVLEARLAAGTECSVPAGNLVAIDAVGRGADLARHVVCGEGAARDVVDEGVAGIELGVVIADDGVAEGAMGEREQGRLARLVGEGELQCRRSRRRRAIIEVAEVV